jgi:2-polyprenyl-3-methyl-5-hydroxy-6-metoxy-1,4-benzoquinol methylase
MEVNKSIMKEFWNQRFMQQPDLYGAAPNAYFAEKLSSIPRGKLLLPGEGEGRNAIFAAEHGWEVTAFDHSEVAQAKSLQKAEDLNLHLKYENSSAEDFDFSADTYDMVALIYFHLPESIRQEIHRKTASSLKSDGMLLIEGFGKRQLSYNSGGPKDISMLYDLDTLKNEFPQINWQEEHDGELVLDEGSGHSGNAHVIRLLGKKK